RHFNPEALMPARSWFVALVLAASALVARAADDPYGDPLPAGAKTRLGTFRYRIALNYTPVVSPDAKTIYSRVRGVLLRYDIAGAARAPTPPGAPPEPPLAFSADGARAASAFGTTVVWDTASGKPLVTVKRAVHYFDRGLPLVGLSA